MRKEFSQNGEEGWPVRKGFSQMRKKVGQWEKSLAKWDQRWLTNEERVKPNGNKDDWPMRKEFSQMGLKMIDQWGKG